MFSFKDFIESIKDKDYDDILRDAEQACASAERGSYGVRGAVKKREMGSIEYAQAVKAFLFFMRTGMKPAGAYGEDYKLYKIVCEALVAKKQMNPEVLRMFD